MAEENSNPPLVLSSGILCTSTLGATCVARLVVLTCLVVCTVDSACCLQDYVIYWAMWLRTRFSRHLSISSRFNASLLFCFCITKLPKRTRRPPMYQCRVGYGGKLQPQAKTRVNNDVESKGGA